MLEHLNRPGGKKGKVTKRGYPGPDQVLQKARGSARVLIPDDGEPSSQSTPAGLLGWGPGGFCLATGGCAYPPAAPVPSK